MDAPKHLNETRPGTDSWFIDEAVRAAYIHAK